MIFIYKKPVTATGFSFKTRIKLRYICATIEIYAVYTIIQAK